MQECPPAHQEDETVEVRQDVLHVAREEVQIQRLRHVKRVGDAVVRHLHREGRHGGPSPLHASGFDSLVPPTITKSKKRGN